MKDILTGFAQEVLLATPRPFIAMNPRMSFGERLREIMEARGIDQSTLGKMVGVTSQSVTQWVNGGTQPIGKRVPAIAQALGVSPAELMLPPGAAFPSTAPPLLDFDNPTPFEHDDKFIKNSLELAWMKTFRAFDKEERATAIQMVQLFARFSTEQRRRLSPEPHAVRKAVKHGRHS